MKKCFVRLTWFPAGVVLLILPGMAMAVEGDGTLSLGLSKIFTFFFLTLGPKAVIAPFARSTAGLDIGTRRNIALATTGISLLSIVIASTIGVRVLNNWGISTAALLVAAGIILFLIALESIRSQYTPEDGKPAKRFEHVSIRKTAFKLAFPYVVSPYGVAVVILVLTSRPDGVPIEPILAMLGGIMVLNLVVMLNAQRMAASPYIAPIFAVFGAVLGVLQAALGVQAVITGFRLAGII